MSIAELMRSSGVSSRLYHDFLRPLLLAMLFAPPEVSLLWAMLCCSVFADELGVCAGSAWEDEAA